MATKFNVFTYFDAQTVTSTNTYNSTISNINNQHNIGLDIMFVGTMTGTLTINACNDGVNFKPITFNPGLAQPGGSNLSYLVSLNQVPWEFIQVSYTNATGSGTLNCIMTSKDLG